MGAQQSKDELLYQQVNYGNIEGIKALRNQGAGLEVCLFVIWMLDSLIFLELWVEIILDWMVESFLQWMDKEGKTPLILACMRHDLLHVAKALIEMGANVNAYRPGKRLFLFLAL